VIDELLTPMAFHQVIYLPHTEELKPVSQSYQKLLAKFHRPAKRKILYGLCGVLISRQHPYRFERSQSTNKLLA
jgi:hypothetical protein